MDITQMEDDALVQKARDMKGLDKIKKSVDAEIRRRIEEDGKQLNGVALGAPSQRRKLRTADEIASMLLPAFSVDDLYEENEVRGRLTIA